MSYSQIRHIQIQPNQVRDFHLEHEAGANFAIDLFAEHGVVGLDWLLLNLDGAASITVQIDRGQAITIPAGGNRGYSNVKWANLKIVAATNFTLMMSGVHIV